MQSIQSGLSALLKHAITDGHCGISAERKCHHAVHADRPDVLATHAVTGKRLGGEREWGKQNGLTGPCVLLQLLMFLAQRPQVSALRMRSQPSAGAVQ